MKNKNTLVKFLITIVIFFMVVFGFSNQVRAGVIFEDNFDSQADWTVAEPPTNGVSEWCTVGGYGSCNANIPTGWYAYIVGKATAKAKSGKNTLNINSSQPRGGSGKSVLYWNEPALTSSGSWGSDANLWAYFPNGYNELYYRYFMKVQPGWTMATTGNQRATADNTLQKWSRVSAWSDSGNPSSLFSCQNHAPYCVFPEVGDQIVNKWTGGTSYINPNKILFNNPNTSQSAWDTSTCRYKDQVEFSQCNTGYENGCPLDGNWHSYQTHVKLNSAPGVADGGLEWWFDGVKINCITKNNVDYIVSGQNMSNNFKIVAIGGNNFNLYQTPDDEQWHAYDDVVVSTNYIPDNYVIGGGTPPPSDNASPVTTASPTGGTYASTQAVTLSRNESGTTYYTTSGSNPTISSTIYSSPLTISQTTTLKFFSKDTAGNLETIKTENYTINSQSVVQQPPVTLWQNASAHTTTRPHNRKLIYHLASGYYFAFYGTGATVKTNRWTSSADGKTWSAGGVTNPVNGHGSSNDYFLDGNKIISVNAENGYGNPNTCYYKLKEWAISSGSLSNVSNKVLASWTCPASVAGSPDPINEANAVGYGSMTKDTNGYYWIAALKGSNNTSSYIYAYKSPSSNTTAGTWANPTLVDNFPVGTETAPDIIALDSGKMLLIMEEDDVNGGTTDNRVRVALYNGSNWEAPYTLFNDTQIANKMRTTAEFDPQTNKLHFLYEDASANLRHMTLSSPYGQGNWSAKPGIVVASGLKTSGEMDSSLEIDLTTSPASLYAIYVKSNGYYSLNNYDGVSGIWTGEKTFGAQTGGEANEGSMIKEYQGKVAAVYSVNNGAGGRDVIFQEYAIQSVTQPSSDTAPPSVPANLTAAAISSNRINLAWTANAESDLNGYKIYRDDGQVFVIAKTNTSYADNDLIPGLAYSYRISAYDTTGNESGKSSSVSATVKITYGIADFTNLLSDWLQTVSSLADVNSDGVVNSRDLGIMMNSWQ